jgi:hypothetical protein
MSVDPYTGKIIKSVTILENGVDVRPALNSLQRIPPRILRVHPTAPQSLLPPRPLVFEAGALARERK